MAYDSLDNLKQLNWNDYGKRVDILFKKTKEFLQKNKYQLSAIVPIIREGMFIGLPFAFKFNTWKIIPIQFKYFLKPKISPYDQVPTLIADTPKLHYDLPKNPIFLVTDVYPGGGKTAAAVGKELKKKYPTSKLIYVSMFQDISFKKPKEYAASLSLCLTDDTDQLSKEEKIKRGVETEYYLMPWHNPDEEMAPVIGKIYNYDF